MARGLSRTQDLGKRLEGVAGHLLLEEHALVRQTDRHPGLVLSSKPEHRLPKRTMIDDVLKYSTYSEDSTIRATRTSPSRHESRRLAWKEERRAQAAGPVGWSRTQHRAAARQAATRWSTSAEQARSRSPLAFLDHSSSAESSNTARLHMMRGSVYYCAVIM